jgi:hypothetical protein
MLKIITVFALSLIPSAVGIVNAAYFCGTKDNAQRGGAIGAVLALGFVLCSRGWGLKLFMMAQTIVEEEQQRARREGEPPPLPEIGEVSDKLRRLAQAIIMDSDEQKRLGLWLAIATAAATVAWGFGDKIADLLPHFHH